MNGGHPEGGMVDKTVQPRGSAWWLITQAVAGAVAVPGECVK
jgi:hypothetical protein